MGVVEPVTRRSFFRVLAAGIGLALAEGARGGRLAFAMDADTALTRSLAELAGKHDCGVWSAPIEGWSRERAVATLSEGCSANAPSSMAVNIPSANMNRLTVISISLN